MTPARPLAGALLGLLLTAACTAGERDAPLTATPTPATVQPTATAVQPTATAAPATATAAVTTAGPPSPTPPPAAAWTRGPDAPLALTEVAAAALGDEVWVVGGLSANGRAVADVQMLDTATGQWRSGPPLPQPRHHTALVSDGERLVVLGGYTASTLADPTEQVAVLDPAVGQWVAGAPLPEPRAAGAAAWDGERIVYGGGVGPDGLSGTLFAGGPGGWTELAGTLTPREHLAAASDAAGTTWFLAGRTGGLDTNLGVVEAVTGETASEAGSIDPRGGIAGFALSGRPCALGGEEPTGTIATVQCLTPLRPHPEPGQGGDLPPLQVARHGLGAAVVDGRVYALLGGDEPGLFVTAVTEVLEWPG